MATQDDPPTNVAELLLKAFELPESAKMSREWNIANIWGCLMRSASSMPGVIGLIIGRRLGTVPIPCCRRPWPPA